MRDMDMYRTGLEAAIEKSIKWKQLPGGFTWPTGGHHHGAAAALPMVRDALVSCDLPRRHIRTNCVGVHMMLAKFLLENGVPSLPMIGNVLVAGEPKFRTSYQRLKREIRGVNKFSDHAFDAHVWLTFLDGHIIDATFRAWDEYQDLPDDWSWTDHVMCSSDEETLREDVVYKPMLVLSSDVVDAVM